MFPQPEDYNLFASVRDKVGIADDRPTEFPRVSLDDLRDRAEQITHRRDRVVFVLQLKTGMRATKLSNVKFEDVTLSAGSLGPVYPDHGASEHVEP